MAHNDGFSKNTKKLIHKICIKFMIYGQKIARESYDYDYSQIEFKNIDHIVFAGMGGSGAIGDIFASNFYQKQIFTLRL